jgi:hypothetical protein
MDKSQNDRVRECLAIMRKITDLLLLPSDDIHVTELRERMNTYIRTGEEWEGVVEFTYWGRSAHCSFPKSASKQVTVTLKLIPFSHLSSNFLHIEELY